MTPTLSDRFQEKARELLRKVDLADACPVHGFEFITMSDGDGHPASWYYFCDHDDHEGEEEAPDLIPGHEYLENKLSLALQTSVQEAIQEYISALREEGEKSDALLDQLGAMEVKLAAKDERRDLYDSGHLENIRLLEEQVKHLESKLAEAEKLYETCLEVAEANEKVVDKIRDEYAVIEKERNDFQTQSGALKRRVFELEGEVDALLQGHAGDKGTVSMQGMRLVEAESTLSRMRKALNKLADWESYDQLNDQELRTIAKEALQSEEGNGV